MENTQTPMQIDGITEGIYAGFWSRFASMFLDAFFILPFLLLTAYIGGLGTAGYFSFLVANLAFMLWYCIYLPKKYGGTPGKFVVGIKIIRLDGQPIDWKEATLRQSVLFAIILLSNILVAVCFLKGDEATYFSLDWIKRSEYLESISPLLFQLISWVTNIWFFVGFVFLLTDKRKRAVHDFIAGTVVVWKKTKK